MSNQEAKDLKLKGGALIIGSLLWQDNLVVGSGDGLRKKWRDTELETRSIQVKLPIRYGRLSGGGIYTMVFSRDCESHSQLGTGFVKTLNPGSDLSWEQFLRHSTQMSIAEGMKGQLVRKAREGIWCTMSIMLNPTLDEATREMILQKWKSLIINEGGGTDFNDYRFGDEESSLKEDCSLNFSWFEPTNEEDRLELDSLDFIICTTTKQKNPDSKSYPSAEVVARSVLKDKERRYFLNNVKYGISTFQDAQILEELNKLSATSS